MQKFLFVVVLAFILSPDMSFPETQFTKAELWQRFRLFADCKPMDIVVENLNKGASRIGLTKESLQYTAESRLRVARLYDSEASHYLYINIFARNDVFSLELAFKKKVLDRFSGVNASAVTWVVHSLGSYGNSGAPFVLSTLSKYMDQFLAEFLRVNEKACNS